jgi:Fe2+ or Zn2+ uptake regulation protein
MIDALRKTGCRITPQRIAIIDYVAGRSDHPSARQIWDALQSSDPGISLATVYNTLGKLVETGLIRALEFEAADNRYDTHLAPHINLICTGCGRIEDLDHELPVSPEELTRRTGFEAVDFRIEYRGTCARCGPVRSAEGG